MLLGFPLEVWIVIGLEFAERLGYYGTAFMLMTYCTSMLLWSPSAANALINGLYALSPLSACISSGLGDGRWGRPYSLVVFLSIYAVGLVLVSLSSFPFMYHNFPLDPSALGVLVFGTGVVLFAAGYGGMKVSTNPLMADTLSEVYKNDEVECSLAISRLFRWVYGFSNAGALVGIFLPPFLRGLEKRRVVIGSVTYTTGYYIGFSVSAFSCIVGLVLFLTFYRRFRRNVRAPSFVLWRVLACAICVRWRFATGRIRDDAFLRSHRWDLIDYAGYYATVKRVAEVDKWRGSVADDSNSSGMRRKMPQKEREAHVGTHGYDTLKPMLENPKDGSGVLSASFEMMPDDETYSFGPFWIASAKSTVAVCRAFIALPIYWLITNQFSSNMILQVVAVDLPQHFPPEVFNNVNVVALLVSLLVFDRFLFPFLFGDRLPPIRVRAMCGFAIMTFSMLWCGLVQMALENRGVYDDEGHYHLSSGMTMLSAGWLVPPYAMQGVASALVDTTVMEVAYIAAPVSMKGVVMAIYLMASSTSGFLGLALSPWMKPQNATIIIFSLAAALSAVAILFFILNSHSSATVREEGCCKTTKNSDVVVEMDTPPTTGKREFLPFEESDRRGPTSSAAAVQHLKSGSTD